MQILGVIGIRSGSKGVKDKNIRPLFGKPLVGWIIDAARQSAHINRLIVSTDSEQYAQIARSLGAETPYLRPLDLSGDEATDYQFIKHLLTWLQEHEDYSPDIVVRLVATAPLQTAQDIDACIEELLNDSDAHSAVVIAEARQHPMKALKLIDDGRSGHYLVSYFNESGGEVTPVARQSYPKAYFRANVIACRLKVISSLGSLTGEKVRYHLIAQQRALDIDSESDFFLAEQLMLRQGAHTTG